MVINQSFQNWTIITDEPGENLVFEHDVTGKRVTLQSDGVVDIPVTNTERMNNEAYASQFPGSDLGAKVDNAVSALKSNRGIVYISPTDDGSRYSWSTDITITPPNDTGLKIQVADGVEIEYSGSGIPITVDGGGVGGTIPTVDMVGGKWIATGTPTGFLRYQDSRNNVVAPREVKDFTNGSDDAFGIQYRNLDSFCERNWVRLTKFTNTDINIDYKDDSGSGSGTNSMVGNRVDWPVLNYNTYGIRLEGNHKTNYFGQVEAFPNAEDSSAIYMDGDMKNVVFMAPRFDDPPDAYTNTAAFETGPDFFANPTVFSPHYNQIANKIVRNSSGHRVFEFGYDPTDGVFKIGDIDTDKFYIGPLGRFGTIDSGGTEQFKVDNSGNFQTIGNFNATPRFVSRTEYAQEDLTGTTPASDDVAFHDGSGTPSQSLCFADGAGNWYNIVDGNTF